MTTNPATRNTSLGDVQQALLALFDCETEATADCARELRRVTINYAEHLSPQWDVSHKAAGSIVDLIGFCLSARDGINRVDVLKTKVGGAMLITDVNRLGSYESGDTIPNEPNGRAYYEACLKQWRE